MREALLHYFWQRQNLPPNSLYTTDDDPLTILHPGTHNHDAGPDFSAARLKIGKTIWVGQVEIHIKASDWYRHGHQDDPAYDTVVLHVVWEADQPILRQDGSCIPCLELREYLPLAQQARYQRLAANEGWIPCENLFIGQEVTLDHWIDQLLEERLTEKAHQLHGRWLEVHRDWEQLFYESLARGFGLRVNGEAMRQLAERTPLKLIYKHRHQALLVEALLFGQAGLLKHPTDEDEYVRKLRQSYQHLRHLHRLVPMSATVWKYSRLRPAAFPEVRIAMLAQLLRQSDHLWSKMGSDASVPALMNALRVRLSGYWQTHTRLGQACKHRTRRLGDQAIRLILINAVVPMLYFFAQHRNDAPQQAAVQAFLKQLPPEQNKITRAWQRLGLKPTHAAMSQALLQLKRHYCSNKQCHRCTIGQELLGMQAIAKEVKTRQRPLQREKADKTNGIRF